MGSRSVNLIRFGGLAAMVLWLGIPGHAFAGPTYDWTGVCTLSYCNFDDPAWGTLTLADRYVPGTFTENADDFVSFSYTYYEPNYGDPPPDRFVVSNTVTRDGLGDGVWSFDPNAYLRLEPANSSPSLVWLFFPVEGSSRPGDWYIGDKAEGNLTSFGLRPQSVPEPGVLALLVAGLAGLGIVRRRRLDICTCR